MIHWSRKLTDSGYIDAHWLHPVHFMPSLVCQKWSFIFGVYSRFLDVK